MLPHLQGGPAVISCLCLFHLFVPMPQSAQHSTASSTAWRAPSAPKIARHCAQTAATGYYLSGVHFLHLFILGWRRSWVAWCMSHDEKQMLGLWHKNLITAYGIII
mmetsp:Transcript_96053/g.165606  ORF Transcript_96053/g.165606 Transcript_96053/m.165606 type:complete len:106 (-) Transcript_96053:1297-1614(-)